MASASNLKQLTFLVYGLGLTGQSVVKFFNKNRIKDYQVWDDQKKNLFKSKRSNNLDKTIRDVTYIILSPGISFNQSKNSKKLFKYRNKIITDIDLIFLLKKNFKSIVVTGTNGKSTTCKIIYHVLKKNKFKPLLGGNIGTPVLNLDVKKENFLVIEASSFQLAYSKFICPDYAILLNITNDHLDWHGNMQNYINSKLKIFKLQKKNQFSIVNKEFIHKFKKNNFSGKLIIPKFNNYKKLKSKISNYYIKSKINDENMSSVLALTKILNIKENSFLKSLKSFKGLPHRYEVFLKYKDFIFINDSKATSFQATKFALQNTKNIFWILGGLPKKNDKILLKDLKKNIVKSYLIGRHINFFKKQIKNNVEYCVTKNLKKSLIQIFKDVKLYNLNEKNILLSPAAASYDQFYNFEERGEVFKKLSKHYVRKYF